MHNDIVIGLKPNKKNTTLRRLLHRNFGLAEKIPLKLCNFSNRAVCGFRVSCKFAAGGTPFLLYNDFIRECTTCFPCECRQLISIIYTIIIYKTRLFYRKLTDLGNFCDTNLTFSSFDIFFSRLLSKSCHFHDVHCSRLKLNGCVPILKSRSSVTYAENVHNMFFFRFLKPTLNFPQVKCAVYDP